MSNYVDDVPRLTAKQAAILGAYTGVLLGSFSDMHEYVEHVMERPVWTHELASEKVAAEIRDKAKDDLLALVPENTYTYKKG